MQRVVSADEPHVSDQRPLSELSERLGSEAVEFEFEFEGARSATHEVPQQTPVERRLCLVGAACWVSSRFG